jgi:hypothetical protein
MAASTDINLSDYLTLDGGPLLAPPRQAAASNPSEPPPSFHTLQSRFSDYHWALLKAKNDLLAASPEDVAVAARKCQDIIVSNFYFIFYIAYTICPQPFFRETIIAMKQTPLVPHEDWRLDEYEDLNGWADEIRKRSTSSSNQVRLLSRSRFSGLEPGDGRSDVGCP